MKKTFLMLAGIILATPVPAQTNAALVRLAIVPETAESRMAADVLTADFAKNDKVQLLERAEIEKVYREQGLSAANRDYLKLGQVLGADGLLALQTLSEGTNQFLSVQLVAVRPGVVLVAERYLWPMPNLTEWSPWLAQHLDAQLPKLAVLRQDAIPLSVVNFHAGVRTAAAADLERQIFFLTIERLAREPRLFVLERKRMQSLSGEKDLAAQEVEPFWNGKYLLDGAIDRDGYSPDQVTISARLIPPGGRPVLIEARGSRTNYAEVVNQLAGKILAVLKLQASPAAWNMAAEADNFFKEAQWNLAWKIFPQARQSAEAAWALGKHDTDCMNLRVRTFMPPPDSGVIYFPPREKPSPEKIDEAIQAARLYQEFSRNLPPDEPKPDSDWYQLGLENLTIATRVLQQFNWSPEFYEPVADRLAELRAQSRTLAELLSRSPSVHDSYFVGSRKVKYDDLHHFQEQPSIYELKVEGGCLWQEKPEDTLALYRELMASPVFRYLHGRFWFREGDSICSLPRLPDRLVAWNNADQKRLSDLWQSFVTELKESPNVFLQMEARALRLADTGRLSKMLSMAGNPDAYKIAYKKYDKELTFAFTDFFDAFVTNRFYFKTNNADVLYLNWGVGDLVERMGGDVATGTKESLRNQFRTEYAAKLAAKDEELGKQLAARDEELRAENSKTEKLQIFEKQKAFLKAKAPFDPNSSSFDDLFIFGFEDYSHEQALEIKPLLVEYKKGLSGTWAGIGKMQVEQVEAKIESIIHPAAATPPPSPAPVAGTDGGSFHPSNPAAQTGRPPWLQSSESAPPFGRPGFSSNRRPEPATEPDTPTPDPLVSSNIITVRDFYPLPMEEIPGDKPHYFQFTDHQWIEGKLLFDFRYNAFVYSFDKNANWQSSADKIFIGMAVFDPDTRRWTVAVLPDPFTEPVNFTAQQSFLWRGNMYSCHAGKIQKYDSLKQAWQPAGFAVEGGQFYNLDGRLYRTDYNSIQEITENGHATKLLASIQRQPPVSSLDSQGALMNLALFADAQKSLCAAVHNKIYRWDGNDWHEIGAAATSFAPAVFDEGVLFPTDGFNLRPARISGFNTRSNSVELYLSQTAQEQRRHGYDPRRADVSTALKPLWKLPAELSLPNFSAALWQSDLYLLADHSEKQDIQAEEHGTRPDGTLETSYVITGSKFVSKDGYNVSLFCFFRDLPVAHKVRLKFEASDGCPPMAGVEYRSGFTMRETDDNRAWMQFTTHLLLCGRYAAPANFKPGIWVASLDSIASEVNALKQMQSDAVLQQKAKADHLAQDTQAKDQQALQAFLLKYDLNHNGIIDDDELDAAREDPYYLKFRLEQMRAQKRNEN